MGGAVSKPLLDSVSTLSDENRKLLEKENDDYTNVLLSVIGPSLGSKPGMDGSSLKTEDVNLGWARGGGWFGGGDDEWYKEPAVMTSDEETTIVHKSAQLSIKMLAEDDILDSSNLQKILLAVLRNPVVLPLDDRTYFVESDEKADEILKQLGLEPGGKACPAPYHTWEEMSSDEAISRMFFYGLGAVLTHSQSAIPNEHDKEELGPLVVDMDLSRYAVRPGFAKYGSRLHFDSSQKLTAIYDYGTEKLVKPGDGESWEKAKFMAKVTLAVKITAQEHLFWTHLTLSNTMTRVKTQELPPNHPIRRLLTVFTFRTNLVNNGALGSLIPNLSLFHRGTGFTFEALNQIHFQGFTECNIFQPFPKQEIGEELKKMSDDGTFPYHSEGLAWYDVVRTFVSEWIEKAGDSCLEDKYATNFFRGLEVATLGQKYQLTSLVGDKDAQIDILAHMIWTVTAYHEMVGTVVDYTRRPSHLGLRCVEDPSKVTVDLQSWLIAMAITATTAIRMPALVDDFVNFFGKGGAPEWEIEVWANFQSAIQEQSKAVQAADAERKTEFKTFDPARFECAVSV